MSGKRVFDTRGAPEEEIAGIRELLQNHELDFYETSAGNWGLGSAALWITDEENYEVARRHIDEFQRDWQLQARETSEVRGINWQRVPALAVVILALAWVFYKSFQW
jgi:hypothetical protein